MDNATQYVLESALKANINNSKNISQLTELVLLLADENDKLKERVDRLEKEIRK